MVQLAITAVQAIFRQWLARRAFYKILLKRLWAALEIQRMTRGFFGRKRMGWRIEEFVATERMKLRKDREAWEMSRAACLIQRTFRRHIAVSVRVPARERDIRESTVLLEFTAKAKQEMTNRLKYELGIKHFFLNQRKNQELAKHDEKFVTREKVKLKRRRWQQILSEWKDNNQAKAECESMRLEDKVSEWSNYWLQTKASRLQEVDENLRHCLLDARYNPTLSKTLKAEAKKHLKRIFYEAEQVIGHNIEIDEAFLIALHRAIAERKAAEEVRVVRDMHASQQDLVETLAMELKLRKDREEADAKKQVNAAATIIQSFARATTSRAQLRSLALEVFTKEFDAIQFACVYVNRQSGETYTRKPRALGPWDLLPSDKFFEISDPTKGTFYLNPFTGHMQYTKPSSPDAIAGCDQANRRNPKKNVQTCYSCPDGSSERFCTACVLFFCVECFNEIHSKDAGMRGHTFRNALRATA
jgi:hypothetical protein